MTRRAPRILAAAALALWSGAVGADALSRVSLGISEVAASVAPHAPVTANVHPDAVDLIVRWEVSSRARYDARFRGVIWPGGASGPTWGIGYDGGHQLRATIHNDWLGHPEVARLVTTSGVTGTAVKARLPEWRGIDTPFDYAMWVFRFRTLLEYERRAARAFRDGWDTLPWLTQGALVSLVYNRGASVQGASRAEMRTIQRDCVPRGDSQCVARELRRMCRIWKGTPNGPGLCNRRNDEANLAERGGQ